MVKAQCTQKDLPYSFKTLHEAIFTETSSYGSITMNSFSGIGVVQERSDERRYWSNVFYMGPPNNRDIHFTITWHDDARITVSMRAGQKELFNVLLINYYSKYIILLADREEGILFEESHTRS